VSVAVVVWLCGCVMVCWCIGVLVYWCIGVLVYWCDPNIVHVCSHKSLPTPDYSPHLLNHTHLTSLSTIPDK